MEQEMRVGAKKETAFAAAQRVPVLAAEPALMDRLDELEPQSVFILREAFARLQRIAILWSLGKDSNVMIWLARKAFFGRVPCPVMHVDTGKKFPEMYAFRNRYAKEWQLDLPPDRSDRSNLTGRRPLGRAENRRAQARAR